MAEETDSTGQYRFRSLEEILAPYSDPEMWREQLDDVQNPEIRALFEERLEALEAAPPESPEAAIKHMLAPIDAAAATADGSDLAESDPAASESPYSEEQILSCARVIAEAMTVREVWLFGSIARGDADGGSNVDLLVVLPDDHQYQQPTYDAKLSLAKSGTLVPTDVVVITESQRRAPTSPLIEDALREGRRLL